MNAKEEKDKAYENLRKVCLKVNVEAKNSGVSFVNAQKNSPEVQACLAEVDRVIAKYAEPIGEWHGHIFGGNFAASLHG